MERETEVRDQREEENTAENGQESDAVGGGHSVDTSSDEWEDMTEVTEVHEQNVSTAIQNEGHMPDMTRSEEDIQGIPRISGAGNDDDHDGDRHLLMGCLLMVLVLRVHTTAQMLTTLTSVVTTLIRIFELRNQITKMETSRCARLTEKFESNKRKTDELDRQLQNAELRLLSLEPNGPQDGSVLLQISLQQHVSMESEIFYTRSDGHNGYKMKITIEENWVDVARRTGRNLDVYFTLLEGEMDALLPWPFEPQISFMFIDNQGGHHYRAKQEAEMTAFQRPMGNSVLTEQKHFCFNILLSEVQHCIDDRDILCLLVDVNNNY